MVCLLSALLSLFDSFVIYLYFQSSSKILAIIARRAAVLLSLNLSTQISKFIFS